MRPAARSSASAVAAVQCDVNRVHVAADRLARARGLDRAGGPLTGDLVHERPHFVGASQGQTKAGSLGSVFGDDSGARAK